MKAKRLPSSWRLSIFVVLVTSWCAGCAYLLDIDGRLPVLPPPGEALDAALSDSAPRNEADVATEATDPTDAATVDSAVRSGIVFVTSSKLPMVGHLRLLLMRGARSSHPPHPSSPGKSGSLGCPNRTPGSERDSPRAAPYWSIGGSTVFSSSRVAFLKYHWFHSNPSTSTRMGRSCLLERKRGPRPAPSGKSSYPKDHAAGGAAPGAASFSLGSLVIHIR